MMGTLVRREKMRAFEAEAAFQAKAGGPEPMGCCGKGKHCLAVRVDGKGLGPRITRLLCVLVFAVIK